MVVATLRSRGIDTYTTDDGPVYEVSGLTDVNMDCTGVYSEVNTNPFATFGLSATTANGDDFFSKHHLMYLIQITYQRYLENLILQNQNLKYLYS